MTTLDSIREAHRRIGGSVSRTPCLVSQTLSHILGCSLTIKFENLQFTSSFKERGALNCLLARSDAAARGVIAMSAGNHAQALAYHARRLGVPATIVMPRSTPNAKVEATRVFGAEILLEGATFSETLHFTEALAARRDLHLIHPFDDPEVIAGQGTVALEMIEQAGKLDALVVPVGGGGLMAGVATVFAALAPETRLIGVQTERFPGAYNAIHGGERAFGSATVAEGIAVKEPGAETLPILRDTVDQFVLVSEESVEQAVFELLEIEKTVAEGAGAAPLAAIRQLAPDLAGRSVGMILSGGNIDMMTLSSVLQRGLIRTRRLVQLEVEIPDTPGALSKLTGILGELDSNIIDIEQQRAFGASSVRATRVRLVLQLRGEERSETIDDTLRGAGYSNIRLTQGATEAAP